MRTGGCAVFRISYSISVIGNKIPKRQSSFDEYQNFLGAWELFLHILQILQISLLAQSQQ